MTSSHIAVLRLHNQQIARSRFQQPHELLAWLGAAQGQDYSGALWALGLRLPGSTEAQIEQALLDRIIVRTWALRGTLHMVAADDLRWLLELLAPRVLAGAARRFQQLGLDEPTLARSNRLIADALSDGQPHSRTELFAWLDANGVSTQGQRGYYMLIRASWDGLIAQGVAVRNAPTFWALDGSLPAGKSRTRDEALAELAGRYFISHGPATLKDFVWWSGLTTGDARLGLEGVKAELAQETFDDQIYWFAADLAAPPDADGMIYLLPGFDEYLLGYRDRRGVLDPQFASRIAPGGNGVFYPTIVSNGQVVGVWKRTLMKSRVLVSAEPFTSLTPAEAEAFAIAAQRFGDYLGLPTTLV
ncbi:MAG: winged helix DNA-binding domain-containing protein [Caldilineaceae bacterium]|nr:winged helix DNA-binding domain-containing protein [Caldilineaceae bacterium]